MIYDSRVLHRSRRGVFIRKVQPFLMRIEPAPLCPELSIASARAMTLDWRYGSRSLSPIDGPLFAAPSLFQGSHK